MCIGGLWGDLGGLGAGYACFGWFLDLGFALRLWVSGCSSVGNRAWVAGWGCLCWVDWVFDFILCLLSCV